MPNLTSVRVEKYYNHHLTLCRINKDISICCYNYSGLRFVNTKKCCDLKHTFYLELQYLKFPAGLKDFIFLLMVARNIQEVANYINMPSPGRIRERLSNKYKVFNLILVILFNRDMLLFDGSLCML